MLWRWTNDDKEETVVEGGGVVYHAGAIERCRTCRGR